MSIHSRFNSTALATALLVAFAACGSLAHAADMPIKAAPVATPFFLVNDNSVSFTLLPGSTDPGIYGATYVPRAYQFDLTRISSVNRWGTNFIDFNFQQYGKKDPVVSMYGAQGSEEADALVRNTLSGNAFLWQGLLLQLHHQGHLRSLTAACSWWSTTFSPRRPISTTSVPSSR